MLVDIERLDTKATDTAHGYDPILGGLVPTDDGTQEGASRPAAVGVGKGDDPKGVDGRKREIGDERVHGLV